MHDRMRSNTLAAEVFVHAFEPASVENLACEKSIVSMQDNDTAKTICTVSIWIATTIILTFGIFKSNWNGGLAMLLMLVVVGFICGAAALSTAAIWGWRLPGRRPSNDDTPPDA